MRIACKIAETLTDGGRSAPRSVRSEMARKTNSRPWLQVFQKPKSQVSSALPPDNSANKTPPVLLEDDPTPQAPPPDAPNRVGNAVRKVSEATRRVRPILRAWKWQLIWLAIFAVFGGTGAIAFLWLSKVPPAVDCRQISNWSADSERLYCAQQAAQTGKPEAILASIQLVKNWTIDHPLYAQSQALLQEWSNALLNTARDRVNARDVKGAVSLANQIPASSPVYKEAQAAIDRWQAEFRRGQAIYDKIQDALKKQFWDEASKQIGQLSLVNDPGWQDRLGEIREQANFEKAGAKALQDARNFAKANPPDQLGQAIALTDPINRKSYVWMLSAQKEVVGWRNTIFALALAQLDQQNLAGASSLINSIPKSVQLTSANRDFVRLVRAREIDAIADYRAPNVERIVPLMVSAHLIKQIEPSSPFFSRAKALIPRLEQETQDLLKLNVASTLANFQQVPALKIAIDEAKTIDLKRPGRLHAQTLLAQWQKESQLIEDRPLLTRAQQVAKSGKLESLRSAVAMARLIKPQRALRSEAQTNMSTWIYQIQVIEDRPILNAAKATANSGQLGAAIDIASKIRSGRALYAEAQDLIGGWVYQIQIIEDRPILAQASGLASQGYLTRAIDLASSIAPNRALYGEAQGLIGQWAAQRAEIWRQRATQSAPSDAPTRSTSEPTPSPR